MVWMIKCSGVSSGAFEAAQQARFNNYRFSYQVGNYLEKSCHVAHDMKMPHDTTLGEIARSVIRA
jgi:hypothetical protein